MTRIHAEKDRIKFVLIRVDPSNPCHPRSNAFGASPLADDPPPIY
jgi:hypothetical protein